MIKRFIILLLFCSPFAFLVAQKGEVHFGLHSGLGLQTVQQINNSSPNFSANSTGVRESGLNFSYLFTKNIAVYLEGAVKQHWQEYYLGASRFSAMINSARYSFGMRMPFKVAPNGLEFVVDYGYYYEKEYSRFNEYYDANNENLKPPLINNHGLMGAFGVNFRFTDYQKFVPSIHFKVNMDVGGANDVVRHSHVVVLALNYRV